MPTNYLTASIRQSLSGSNPNMPATITNADLLKLLNAIEVAQNAGVGDILANGTVPFTGQETFGAGLKTDSISPDGTSLVSFTSMIGLKSYTSAQEALLVPTTGATIWNSDLNSQRTYNGSAWSNSAPSANPTFTGVVKVADGTAANPSLTFASDPDTGIILSAANSLGFVTNGVEKWSINSSGSLNPITDNTYDIGNGLVNPRDVTASRYLIAPSITNVLGNVAFDMSVADTLSITASAGVSVSDDLLVNNVKGLTSPAQLTVGSIPDSAAIELVGSSAVINFYAASGVTFDGAIRTASAVFWDLGDVSANAPQTQDAKILVTLGGVGYYLHATAV